MLEAFHIVNIVVMTMVVDLQNYTDNKLQRA